VAREVVFPIRAEDKTQQAFRSVRKNLDGLRRTMTSLRGAIAVSGFTYLVKSAAQAGDEIAKFSKRIGINAQALQELQFAATQAGIRTETFNMAMQRFTRRSAEAAIGTGEAKDALRTLGIQLTDSQGQLRPAEQLLGDVAEAFKKIESPADRVRLAFKLFDAEGVAMLQMLGDGKAAMEAMREEARRLGIVMSEDTLKNAEKINDQFDIMARVIGTNLNTALVETAPLWTTLSQGIANAAKDLNLFLSRYKEVQSLTTDQLVAESNRLGEQIASMRASIAGKDEGDRFRKDVEAQLIPLEKRFEELQARLWSTPTGSTPQVMMPTLPIVGDPRKDEAKIAAAFRKTEESVRPALKLQRDYEAALRSVQEARQAGLITDENALAMIRELNKAHHENVLALSETKDKTKELKDTSQSTFEAIKKAAQDSALRLESSITDALIGAEGQMRSFGDMAMGVLRAVATEMIRMNIARPIASGLSSAIGSLDFSSIGSMFGFATGGRPPLGRTSIVGENGPELFVPDQAGTIVPNGASAGAVTVNFNLTAVDTQTGVGFLLANRANIVGMVQEAFNRRGARGPLG
jgi:hypothetical protein